MFSCRILFFSFCLLLSSAALGASHLSVTRVQPAGDDVAQRDQIVIEFNRNVVPLGRMDRKAEEIPVSITPAVNCHWRWLARNTLACQLDDKDHLRLATRYIVVINPGFKAEDGGLLVAAVTHQFVTTRPNISNVWISTWAAPTKPVIRIEFNQPVTQDSLKKYLFFANKNTNKRIAINLEKEPKSKESDEEEPLNDQSNEDSVWLVIPKKDLSVGGEVSLIMEPGVASKVGMETNVTTKELLKFYTFAEFKFLGASCKNNLGEEIVFTSNASQDNSEKHLCDPLSIINLRFTAPVVYQKLNQGIQLTPAFKMPTAENIDVDYLLSGVQPNATYVFNLPISSNAPLKSMQRYTINFQSLAAQNWWAKLLSFFGIQPKGTVADIFGRHLENPTVVSFATGHRKSHYVLPYNAAVLEKNTDSDVPFYVTNVNSLELFYDKLTQTGVQKDLKEVRNLPVVNDLQYAVPLEIRKLLGNQSGIISMDIYTQPKITDAPAYLLTQITPYQVQAKIGHFNSLIWVTDFATGTPVANAKVQIYPSIKGMLTTPENVLATVQTDKNGIAYLPGAIQFLSDKSNDQIFWSVRVDTASDMAWLPFDYDFQVSSFRAGDVYSYTREKYGHVVAWGTTAQGIYRPGETIQYKIYVRDQSVNTLVSAPAGNYKLDITDPTGKTVETIDKIKLDEFGTLQGEYTVPKEAVAGWYQFVLSGDFAKDTWEPMRVLVTDFTPSPFKVTSQLNGTAFTTGQTVEITTAAKLHAGGPYGNAETRLTAVLIPKTFTTKNPALKDFDFYQPIDDQNATQIYQQQFNLDKNGESRAQFKLKSQTATYGKLSIESAVRDERGKYVAGHASADYFAVDRYLGWHPKEWVFVANKPARVDYVVVDTQGNPVADVPVDVVIEREANKAVRVKSAGEVYTTEYKQTWEKVGECKEASRTTPSVCVFVPKQSGSYRLTAKLNDSKGVAYTAQTNVWVTGGDYVMWDQATDAAIPIVPEKASFQVGEKANFLIKNPYPGAMALITVERYGVIDHWVQKLEGSTPVITVPIKSDYLPGFYLSVSVFSPRANDKPLEIGQLDLAKPSVRFGYQKVVIDDPYKQLIIHAKTDHETYKPGETVQLQMQVKPRAGGLKPIELAVAVVDESVLDLLRDANKNYDVYHGLYRLEDLDLLNYSLLNRLVGRQKFEKKGANTGGDGGAAFSMRSLFKYVSYWNPAVIANKQGQANVSFTVPDNLTRWRVIILGVTKTDQMGTGTTDFVVNRATEIRPLMPNQVLEGDHFVAGFSVMNRINKPRTLAVDIDVAGAINTSDMTTKTQTTTVELQPFERKIITMPVVVGNFNYADTKQSLITFTVKAGDAFDQDGLIQTVSVEPLQSLETVASYGTSDENNVQASVEIPNKIRSNVGQLSLALSPTVIGNIEGVFRFARDYPYTCWEQKLSKAVLASQYKALKSYLAASLHWSESDELPNKTLQDAVNYQANNGGMAYFIGQDEYADPYLSAYTALAFTWLQQQGYKVPEVVTKSLTTYLQNFLRQNRSRDFYTQSMTATVRAVALSALAQTAHIETADLDRLRDYIPNMSLFGLANYLQAVIRVPNSDVLQQTILNKIMSHAQQEADKLVFTETLDDGYRRILASPLRDNCAVLTALLDYQQAHPKENYQDQIFKMVRGITQARGARDHWENTQENLFCMNALVRYGQVFEKQAPNMQLTAKVNDEKFGTGHLLGMKATTLMFARPLQEQDIGKKMNIAIQRDGKGRYYYNARLQYAPLDLLAQDENHGIELHREYSVQRNGKWELLNINNGVIKQGELVRVDLYLNLTAPRNFVVVDDPVASGLEPVNAELATSSQIDAAKANYAFAGGSFWFKYNDWQEYGVSFWSFYHQEIRNNAVRFYADHLDPGHYHLNYVAQAISSGDFSILPTFAEEMYSPEVNGKTKAGKLVVK